jgi:flagellar hook-associated protein 2
MSSIASPVSSSSANTYFNGMSNYSASLNNEISQEVNMASLPIDLLDNDVTTLTNQSTELGTLNTDFGEVQSSISDLASAAGSTLAASVSDSSATTTLGSGATAGTYTLGVSSLGSYSDAISGAGSITVTDPTSQNISASDTFTLTVNNVAITPAITLSGTNNNLNGLAAAINNADANVQATVVDVGTNSAPDYRLSLQSNQLGPVTMQVTDGTSQPLMETTGAGYTAGTPAQYSINGQPVTSTSDTVTLAPGLTAQLTGTNTTPATITVAADPSGIGSAFQSFVSSYNSAITELGKNIGQGGGALAGESIVYQLTDTLQGLANYTSGTGNISSMAALGLTFNDTTGQLSFDQSTFDSATSSQTAALTAFLGSTTSGGFIEAATNAISSIADPTTGTLTSEITSVQADITSTNSQIANETAQVTQLQTNLTQQMSAADAMIYELQQQSTEIDGIFTAQQDSDMTGL